MNEFTLRNKIADAKAEYEKKYGGLDWHWNDEGLIWAVQDYHGSKGSVLDFTEDDWRVCKENGLNLYDVLNVCDEEWFDRESMVAYLYDRINDWMERPGVEQLSDIDIPKEDALGFIEDFYTWHKELLPKAQAVFEEVRTVEKQELIKYLSSRAIAVLDAALKEVRALDKSGDNVRMETRIINVCHCMGKYHALMDVMDNIEPEVVQPEWVSIVESTEGTRKTIMNAIQKIYDHK